MISQQVAVIFQLSLKLNTHVLACNLSEVIQVSASEREGIRSIQSRPFINANLRRRHINKLRTDLL